MLDLKNISKTFNPGTVNEKVALENVNLHLDDGDFATIVGSNGAGKSTLFNAIAGEFIADTGTITLDGRDITFLPDFKRSKAIGRMFQDPLRGTAPHMTIEENLALAFLRASGHTSAFSRINKKDRELFAEKLSALGLGLEDRMKQPVGLLSGGQRQALTLLMAIGATLLALPGGIALAGLAWRYGGLVRRLLFLWAEIIRGIPLIFVIFWLWYLLPMLTGGDLPGAVTVTLALAWFTAASVMHSVLAGLQSLPKGQYEAALTQGFAPGQTLRLVLLPQALRNVQPSLVGIFIGLLKDTSLAFIVNVPELTTVAGQVNNRVQIYPLAIFVFTGAVYYLLCCGLSLLAGALPAARPPDKAHSAGRGFSGQVSLILINLSL